MIPVARVNLWGTMVGAVAWDDAAGCAAFEFDKNFIRVGLDLAPLMMPLSAAAAGRTIHSFPQLSVETFKGLPGLLADSLPDRFGNTLIDNWLAREGRSPADITAIDRLCYTGRRGMGALEFEPAYDAFNQPSSALDIGRLVDLAGEILSTRSLLKSNLRNNSTGGIEELIRVGSSAGGARAKAVIAYNESTGEVRSGQLDAPPGFGYWIIKLDGVTNKLLGDPKGYGNIEYAYHLMARAAGITMTECRILRETKRSHFMTERFDRRDGRKLHMQSLCAIAHLDYNIPGVHSYEQAFQALRRLKTPYSDSEQLFRRMVFNVVARNQDDHTKNIAFLMNEQGVWRLSPAYDVTYACDPANRWLKAHQMSINGKLDSFTMQDLLDVAKNMGIKKPTPIVNQVTEAVSSWPRFAKEAGVSATQIRPISKMHRLKLP